MNALSAAAVRRPIDYRVVAIAYLGSLRKEHFGRLGMRRPDFPHAYPITMEDEDADSIEGYASRLWKLAPEHGHPLRWHWAAILILLIAQLSPLRQSDRKGPGQNLSHGRTRNPAATLLGPSDATPNLTQQLVAAVQEALPGMDEASNIAALAILDQAAAAGSPFHLTGRRTPTDAERKIIIELSRGYASVKKRVENLPVEGSPT